MPPSTSPVPHSARRWIRRDASDLLSLVTDALARYKLRTALSILGIVLGVAAVIAMLSVGEGARRETLRQVEALGMDNIVVRYRGIARGQSDVLTVGDATRLARLVPMTRNVVPAVQRFVPLSGPARTQMAVVLGVTAAYRDVLNLRVARGRFLMALDDESATAVCVLGAQVSLALFGYQDPVGQLVKVGGTWYRVVGLLGDRGDAAIVGSLPVRDLNRTVLVPLGSVVGHAVDVDPNEPVDEIWLQLTDGSRSAEIGRVIDHTLALRHKQDQYEVTIPKELLRQSLRVQRTFTVVIGSIAAIALLVGGIGIMNIMLASVLERTAEIGLRRAVGASRRDVIVQFLTESLALTVTGGALGIFVGVGVSWGITAYAGWATHLSLWAVAVAVIVSCGVGLAFGSYPAARAAALQPIDAVRYE